jgi:hypothetical protein
MGKRMALLPGIALEFEGCDVGDASDAHISLCDKLADDGSDQHITCTGGVTTWILRNSRGHGFTRQVDVTF